MRSDPPFERADVRGARTIACAGGAARTHAPSESPRQPRVHGHDPRSSRAASAPPRRPCGLPEHRRRRPHVLHEPVAACTRPGSLARSCRLRRRGCPGSAASGWRATPGRSAARESPHSSALRERATSAPRRRSAGSAASSAVRAHCQAGREDSPVAITVLQRGVGFRLGASVLVALLKKRLRPPDAPVESRGFRLTRGSAACRRLPDNRSTVGGPAGRALQLTLRIDVGFGYPAVVKNASVRFAVLPVFVWMKNGTKWLPMLSSPS